MKDTLSRETLFFLDSFLVMKKTLRFLNKDFFAIRNEVKTITKQLADLKKDVDNGLVNETHFEEYFKMENDNFRQMHLICLPINENFIKDFDKYERMTPKVDSIISAYKAKINE